MKNIVYIIGAIIGVIGAFSYYFFNGGSTSPYTKIEDEDKFGKDTIKKWIDSLDFPDMDSSYRFYAIKIANIHDLGKLHIKKEDKYLLKSIKGKVLIALVLTNSNRDTQASTLFVCNGIDPSFESNLKYDVTELNLNF